MFGGSTKTSEKLAAAPPFEGDVAKPSASAKPYPTTSNPEGYVLESTRGAGADAVASAASVCGRAGRLRPSDASGGGPAARSRHRSSDVVDRSAGRPVRGEHPRRTGRTGGIRPADARCRRRTSGRLRERCAHSARCPAIAPRAHGRRTGLVHLHRGPRCR
jgi:hypothetical protein